MPNALERLRTARRVARATEMERSMLIPLSGSSWVLFPWLGTRAFRTLKRYLALNAGRLGISGIQSEGCCYITFHSRGDLKHTFLARIEKWIREEGITPIELVGDGEMPVFDKYDAYLPGEILREAFASDRLLPTEVKQRFLGEEN
jgi:ATP-dependent Lhr-like helicase